MTVKNLADFKKKRSRATQLAELWEKELIHAAKKLKEYRRKEKLYTTLIEKILEAEKAEQPKVPTRIVEA